MSGSKLLAMLPDGCASLGFCDPQYRHVLDKLAFGNEGARQKDRAALSPMSPGVIAYMIGEYARVLRPSGHLVLWVDKYILAEGLQHKMTERAFGLQSVDLIAWDTLRFGMGRRTRSGAEYALIYQREPIRAKGIWTDHSLRDAWVEYADRDVHPHAKPYVLTERLIRACTKPGALVLDAAAGGFGVLRACQASGRDFIGCDIEMEGK